MGWGDSRDPPEIADGFPSKPDDDSAPLLPVLSVGFPAAQCDDDETVRERYIERIFEFIDHLDGVTDVPAGRQQYKASRGLE
mmetsp:Transcript_2161/g.3264  ORF Transcript_2161/g.3264 Transcript_2161/m.3264 type:complete len:82 (+) Transcript_2161:533-778(+)